MKLQKDLREFIALMNSHGAEYLVVGAHAVALYGYPRYTGDIDLWLRRSPENAARISAALGEFGFAGVGIGRDDLLREEHVVALGQPPNRIDLLTDISGVDFERAWSSRTEGDLDGLPVSFISREHLIENKRAAARIKDLADVDQLTRQEQRSSHRRTKPS